MMTVFLLNQRPARTMETDPDVHGGRTDDGQMNGGPADTNPPPRFSSCECFVNFSCSGLWLERLPCFQNQSSILQFLFLKRSAALAVPSAAACQRFTSDPAPFRTNICSSTQFQQVEHSPPSQNESSDLLPDSAAVHSSDCLELQAFLCSSAFISPYFLFSDSPHPPLFIAIVDVKRSL